MKTRNIKRFFKDAALALCVLFGVAHGGAALGQTASAPTTTFSASTPCLRPVGTSSPDATQSGVDFARGMMDCVNDGSTQAGAASSMGTLGIDVSRQSSMIGNITNLGAAGNDRYIKCKQSQATGYVDISDPVARSECEGLIFSYDHTGSSNPYKISATDSVVVTPKQATAALSPQNFAGLSVTSSESCVPPAFNAGGGAPPAKSTDAFCSISRDGELKTCHVSRKVEVASMAQYQCNNTPQVKELKTCVTTVQCTLQASPCSGGVGTPTAGGQCMVCSQVQSATCADILPRVAP